jgi:hypothetical protein
VFGQRNVNSGIAAPRPKLGWQSWIGGPSGSTAAIAHLICPINSCPIRATRFCNLGYGLQRIGFQAPESVRAMTAFGRVAGYARRYGVVYAENEQHALAKAIEQFQITSPHEQKKLVVRPQP